MQLRDKQKPALVLSGGGIKAAAFHIGVCMALREKGFKFAGGNKEQVENLYPESSMTIKSYVGSSAGAVISGFLASGYSIESIIKAFTQGAGVEFSNKRFNKVEASAYLKPLSYKDIFKLNIGADVPAKFMEKFFVNLKKKPMITGGLEVLLKRGFKVNGLFTTENIEKYIREHACPENSFQNLGVNLYIIATQLNHSRKVIFGPFDETSKDARIKYAGYAKLSEAIAASASLPPVFSPYGIENTKGKIIQFFDGEIRDTLSTHVAADHGADLVIASYSMHPYHFTTEMGSLHEYGIPLIFNQALYQCVQQKIDSHIHFRREVTSIISAVEGYMKQANYSKEERDKIVEIMHSRTSVKPEVDYIYIHPSPKDFTMFFADHFSLSPSILSDIVKTGFKAAMLKLRKLS